MSIYSGGEKYYRLAEGVNAKAYNLQKQQQYEEFNRNLLSDVRQARIAAATLQQNNYSDEFTGSGQNSAVANVYSNLAGSYGYAIDSSKRLQEIQNLNMLSAELQKKGQKRDKRSAQAAQITAVALGAVGGFAGAALAGTMGVSAATGAAIGSTVGNATAVGGVYAMSGGKAAKSTVTNTALKNTISAWGQALTTNVMTTDIGNAAKGAQMSGGRLIGETSSGLPIYDLTDTAATGSNIIMQTNNARRVIVSNGIYGSARLPGVYN